MQETNIFCLNADLCINMIFKKEQSNFILLFSGYVKTFRGILPALKLQNN